MRTTLTGPPAGLSASPLTPTLAHLYSLAARQDTHWEQEQRAVSTDYRRQTVRTGVHTAAEVSGLVSGHLVSAASLVSDCRSEATHATPTAASSM